MAVLFRFLTFFCLILLCLTEEISEKDSKNEKAHSMQHDHEVFLGEEESKRFDELSVEESQAQLSKLVDDYIDTDKDGRVSTEELRDWIALTSRKYLLSNRDKRWKDLNLDDNILLDFDSYKLASYNLDITNDTVQAERMKKMIEKDKHRWDVADVDGDKKLSKDEFLSFLHPEEMSHMKEVVIDETLMDIDANGDGRIDLTEYINEIWQPDTEGETEPDWLASERQQFGLYHDKNKDGYLDRDEIRDWILPDDYDHVDSETKHLMGHADLNQDSYLSKDEILHKYEVFVGSQATDFGEALRNHTEL